MIINFSNSKSEIFVPSGETPLAALARTTDLCISAHQDDIEIMAYAPIVACFDNPNRFFTGCVVGDGSGSPRAGIYADYTDEQMIETRIAEQKKAASTGNYSAQVFFNLSSFQIKNAGDASPIEDILKLLLLTKPEVIYTHNLADKHDTHVAVALRVIEAVRRLPSDKRPTKVYSMEVWRGLDWLCDKDKTMFDTSPHPNLAAALLGVYDSQIAGGKHYDGAVMGRRLANATFLMSHEIDNAPSLSYALDITELVNDEQIRPEKFIKRYIDNFAAEVVSMISKLQ